MDIDLLRANELTSAHIEAWRTAQNTCTDNANPFFSPDYAEAVDDARGDVYVAMIRDNGGFTGFFPFHHRGGGIGTPVGGPITDYQGVIGRAKDQIEPDDLLRGCKLAAFDYNHLPWTQLSLAAGQFETADSPYLDLSQGFEAYVAGRAEAGTKELKNTERKRRKIVREVGPLRFVANDPAQETWAALVRWKNESYARMKAPSILNVKWVDQTLGAIRRRATPDFSGMLSSLYVGDQLAAVHFGMRSGTAWHWWFPTYDSGLDKYSPGLILLLEMAAYGAANGIGQIDLGRGDARYKSAFASGATVLCEGSIETGASPPALIRRSRKAVHRAYSKLPTDRGLDFQRRAFNRILGVGRLAE